MPNITETLYTACMSSIVSTMRKRFMDQIANACHLCLGRGTCFNNPVFDDVFSAVYTATVTSVAETDAVWAIVDARCSDL